MTTFPKVNYEYTLVKTKVYEHFVYEVNQLLSEGWSLEGGVAFDSHERRYLQALSRGEVVSALRYEGG